MDYRKLEASMTRKLATSHTKKTKCDFGCLSVVEKMEVLVCVKNSLYCFFRIINGNNLANFSESDTLNVTGEK